MRKIRFVGKLSLKLIQEILQKFSHVEIPVIKVKFTNILKRKRYKKETTKVYAKITSK